MKKYWHTWTLFIKWWKFKWAYKYDHCIKCRKADFKHKWKWLCTSCYDRERKNNSKQRKINLKIQNTKHYYKSRILLFLEKKEYKKTWPKTNIFNLLEYRKNYYQKNKEVLKLIAKWNRMNKSWKNPLKIIINWKERFYHLLI